jgi:glycine/D-amino acid oxidase-like deaminating enzyme
VKSAVVVGAGVFGASIARELDWRGWDVTLVEQYTPGNAMSGSGGDTRLMRYSHGDEDWYTQSARHSLQRWRELERKSGLTLFEQVGLAWFDLGRSDFTERSESAMRRLGIPCERLSPAEARRFFPSLGGDDLESVLFEPGAGVLNARIATRALAARLRVEGGRPTPADPPRADIVVWACGSWLGKLFPDLVELRISRRDVFFFGVDASWNRSPGFCEYDGPYYGHGDLNGLGMKIAPDGRGADVDPDTLERVPDPEMEARARAYAARRFPALADAPIVGTRVCQYDLTEDTHFIVGRHPEQAGWWLVGGGSGHGFKHGPALGELVEEWLAGTAPPEPMFALRDRADPAMLSTSRVDPRAVSPDAS